MPDNLEDTISEDVITSEFQEAIKKPSIGVCFFWWAHALGKGKTVVIQRLFSSHSYSRKSSALSRGTQSNGLIIS